MWDKFYGLNQRRKRLLSKTSGGALHDYYATPFPEPKSKLIDSSFIVLDFEATGLDIKKDHIVSIGLVEIDQLAIRLNTAWHQIVRTKLALPQQSTVIHEITDDMVKAGMNIKSAFDTLLARLKGRVLIAHNAKIELGYLKRVCHELYDQDFLVPVIDTQQLAKRQLLRSQVVLEKDSLRLYSLRKRYHLPAYKAHNAFYDALATAELYLALVADLYPGLDCKLQDLLYKY
ncbi:MAG: exonuclease domain-containing protein [Thioalkalispiraceae bacterium]|jgi:DNA polymerase-3 subunit epsilon